MNRQTGMAQIDLIVGLSIMSLMALALGTIQYVSNTSEATVTATTGGEARARAALERMADDLRTSQLNTVSGDQIAIAAGTPTSVTFYRDGNGGTIRYYWQAGGASGRLMMQIDGAQGVVLLENVASINLAYLLTSGSHTANSGGWSPSSGESLTKSELPRVGAVTIDVTVIMPSLNNYTRTLSTKVRLRNSPAV